MSEFSLQVVHDGEGHIRCVYLNDFRLVGDKPYVSEDLAHWHRPFELNELRHCFRTLEIERRGEVGEIVGTLERALREHFDVVDTDHPQVQRGNWAMQCASLLEEIKELVPRDIVLAKADGK